MAFRLLRPCEERIKRERNEHEEEKRRDERRDEGDV